MIESSWVRQSSTEFRPVRQGRCGSLTHCHTVPVLGQGDTMKNIYEQTFETVPQWWIHNMILDLVDGKFDDRSLDDKRVFARWLRGFHSLHFRLNSMAHEWLTCPCEQFRRPVVLYLERYVTNGWPWISEAVPSLPDRCVKGAERLPVPVKASAGGHQGALL